MGCTVGSTEGVNVMGCYKTNTQLFNGLCSGTTRVGRYHKKILLDFYGAAEDNGVLNNNNNNNRLTAFVPGQPG